MFPLIFLYRFNVLDCIINDGSTEKVALEHLYKNSIQNKLCECSQTPKY